MITYGLHSIAARGTERKGRNPAQGSRGFGAPYGPRNSTPRFSNLGSRKPLPRGPLEPRKGSQRPRRGSSGASARGVRFQRSGGKTRWATQRPLRGPVFPDAPWGVPALGLLPSGHRQSHKLFLNCFRITFCADGTGLSQGIYFRPSYCRGRVKSPPLTIGSFG